MNNVVHRRFSGALNVSRPALFAGVLLKHVRIVDDTAHAAASNQGASVELPEEQADFIEFVRDWEAKANKAGKAGKVGMTAMLLLPLAACGGGGGSGFGGGGSGGGLGIVVDGPISGATVWRDSNVNGILDANESSTTTASDGTFDPSLLGTVGAFISTGGTDTVTGMDFTGLALKAPDGSTTISPITTLIQAEIDNGQTLAAAQARVITTLGLTAGTDLITFNPTASDVDALLANEIIAAGQKNYSRHRCAEHGWRQFHC